MKSEYLITFDSKDEICTTVEKFKSLLASHASISFLNKNIIYREYSFPYQLAQGKLTDGSLYYDMTLEDSSPSQHEIYKQLLREIRTICARSSGRKIIVLHDGVSEEHCQNGYPHIYRIENLMRKLISKFMAISIGYDWSDASTPKEVMESVRSEGKKDKNNFLHEVDFIQLSNFLFKKYTKADSGKFIDSLKEKPDEEVIKAGDIKKYSPFTNWEKYFSKNVNCDSDYLRSRWEKLYELRCKIAHCKGLSKDELNELVMLCGEVSEKIYAALDAIGDVHVEEAEREELAENLSGTANKSAADFIIKYNRLFELTRRTCELSSDDRDSYGRHETNKTNIRMQSGYLCNVKGLIDRETAALINKAQRFRNIVVHRVGISDIGEPELVDEMQSIDTVIETISSLQENDLEKLKGIDLRGTQTDE